MEFNNIVFPKSRSKGPRDLENILNDQILYIPRHSGQKKKHLSSLLNLCGCGMSEEDQDFIPCRYISYTQEGLYSKKIIIFFHANAEDIFQACALKQGLSDFFKMNVLIPEYPGYSVYSGNSSASQIE